MFYEGRRAGAPEAATKARPKARRPDGPARPELRLDEAGAPIGRRHGVGSLATREAGAPGRSSAPPP